jgi:hypothetical protein
MTKASNFEMPGFQIDTITDDNKTVIPGIKRMYEIAHAIKDSIMQWGGPGIGKSQSIHDLAHDLELGLKKRCNVIDVRLILFNPIDLRGIQPRIKIKH